MLTDLLEQVEGLRARIVSEIAGGASPPIANRGQVLPQPKPVTQRPTNGQADEDLLDAARQLGAIRKHRNSVFGDADLFGEPAWDMLLDLYVARRRHSSISITSACYAANVPTTTALRWLAVLERKGLVVRSEDFADKRRTFVIISDLAVQLIEQCLRRAASTSNRIAGI